jgi:hypothetical protein
MKGMIFTSTARHVPYLLVGRSDWGVLAITERFSTRKARKIAIRGSKRAKSLLEALGRWMAALGPLVLGAWPGRPSTKAGNG